MHSQEVNLVLRRNETCSVGFYIVLLWLTSTHVSSMCHSLFLTDGKTQSQRTRGRSEHLIISQSLNLTHTYVNNIKDVCKIVQLAFFRAHLTTSTKLRFLEELKSSIIVPYNMKAHCTRYQRNRSKCSCPDYYIFFMCRPKGTFSFCYIPTHSQTKGSSPHVILSKPFLLYF